MAALARGQLTPPRGMNVRLSAFGISIGAGLLFAGLPAHAQAPEKRLSQWLLEQPHSADAYPLGLSWRVPEERASQVLLRDDLLESLAEARNANSLAVRTLRDWIASLPITGRVPLASADARWLEVNPTRDPVLKPGQSVVMPTRPRTVTVVTEEGDRCSVTHSPGREALAYVQACATTRPGADWVWIAQPDGRAQRFGAALWNNDTQDEPAPGAWIFAPSRSSGFTQKVSERLVRFLATQGPAPDQPGAALTVPPEQSSLFSARARSEIVTPNDWGEVGLLQTPTARMARTGQLTFRYTQIRPYTHGNVFVQPFDWLEAGFRYTAVGNRSYDPTGALNTTQSFKDKSLDAKFFLLEESAYVPAVAVGLRDVGGTGLFSGEYVVANKRTGDFDWSIGLGWGYLGARGNIRNPLRVFSSKFDTRSTDVGQGGNLAFGDYFRGATSLFGGVQYQTPWEKLIAKVEYDGNNYQHEPQGNNQRQSSPWNFGLVYRAGRWGDLSIGIERGNTLMFGIALYTDLDRMWVPKSNDPPRVPALAVRPTQGPNWTMTSGELSNQTGWRVGRIELDHADLRVTFEEAEAGYWLDRVDKAAAVLNRDAPPEVDRFILVQREGGVEVSEHVVDRDAWVAQHTQYVAPHERRADVIAREPERLAVPLTVYEPKPRRFEAGLGFDYQQNIGGPDAFLLYQISATERARLWLREDTWIRGQWRLGLVNNYDRFHYTAPSDLPRVRTFLREYLTTSRFTMPVLQATHMRKLGHNQYLSVYGGYLEEMFGGVGGEWLYRPFNGRNAVGVDLNYVKQRDFHQDFAFRDYKVLTGHATLYADTGWNDVLATISAGRYLAGDLGVTVQLQRVFQNGVTVGAYATKTNVSAAKFGEGSFDKGLFVSVPFDAILTRSSGATGYFRWNPLTRDGGQKLARQDQLYDLTSARADRTLWYESAPRPNESVIPADRREPWEPKRYVPEPYTQAPPRPTSEQWRDNGRFEHELAEALYQQGFRNITATYDRSYRLNLNLANNSLRPVSRAVGRAARTALRLAPLETREIGITFMEGGTPVARYEFLDLVRLERYLNGASPKDDVANYVGAYYADASERPADALARMDDLRTDDGPKTLGDVASEAAHPVERAGKDLVAAGKHVPETHWAQFAAIGAGATIASSLLDKRAFTFADRHSESRWLKGAVTAGDAIPWLAIGGAGLAALDGSNPVRQRTGFSAVEAGGTAFLAATALKYAIGRARPDSGLGSHDFQSFSKDNRFNSFPSRHAAVVWAVATPFAEEYRTPWPYAAAAFTSLARVASREHWVSDVVAGGFIGYGLGEVFWQSNRERSKDAPRLMLGPKGMALGWDLP